MTAVLVAILALPLLAIFVREDWIWIAAAICWLGFAATFAARAIHTQASLRIHWIAGVLLLFPLWGGAQLALGSTASRQATAIDSVMWIALAALFLCARNLFEDPAERERFLDLSLTFGGLLACISLLQFFTSDGRIYWWIPTEADAVLGPFRNRNHYASWMLLLFPLAAIRAIRGRWEASIAAAAMAVSIVAGGSRAGIALLIAEVAALGMLLRPHTAPAFAFLPLRDLGNRDDLYASALAIVRERPIAGHGLGAFETVYPAHARFDNGLIVDHAHNDYLEWASEVGVAPAAAMAAVAVWSMRAAVRHPWALGIPAIFLHALVDYPLHKPAIAAWTFVFLAALAAADEP